MLIQRELFKVIYGKFKGYFLHLKKLLNTFLQIYQTTLPFMNG